MKSQTFQEIINEIYLEDSDLAERVIGFLASTPNVENTSVEKLLNALRTASELAEA